ncbi:glycoside hydrolase family 31 protein [Saccharolobus shibatae]|uniref:Alpha-xylosidase n=1 Tax=Saccharolobus shibatae TaxID=2286 RepID=A0A8F5BT30_9CREN|nr:glycoside hydrolase family 31 protein [Saccharolobus shibatae]QXJ30927.1 alpha-xylosidase [Saccharolobus shibatae]
MRIRNLNVEIEFIADNIVRVLYYYGREVIVDNSLVVLPNLEKLGIKGESTSPSIISFASKSLSVDIKTSNGELIIKDNKGGIVVKEKRRDLKFNEELSTYNVDQEFELSEGERLYGLGQHAGGNGLGQSSAYKLDYNGLSVTLSQRNTDIGIPFIISSKGYGILWDNYSLGSISLKGNELRVWFEAGKKIDYYVIFGDSIDDVIKGYRKLTGDAPLLPKWAYGYWQSKERYKSQDELVSVVKEFRERKIPLDVIVLDWRYWGKYGWNAFKFDEIDFPRPKGMVEEIHKMGAKLAISIWPTFGKETEVFKDMESKGCIIPGTTAFNPFKEECRELFWSYVKRFYDIGIDAYWLDASEPETGLGLVFFSPIHDVDLGIGKGYEYLNAYPLMETKAVYEGQRRISDKRVAILTRSAFAGQQRHSAISWSGDVLGDWATLRSQIPAGLNFSISGIPYWTTDTGGFFSGNPETKAYAEIFVRWFQWSTFCPILRVHGTNFPKEPWRFPKEYQDVILKYIRLRYELLPYIYSLAWMTYSNSYTIMRPLVMDFRNDKNVYDLDEQYMFGPYIMVSPVTLPSIKEKEIYLPSDEYWYDFWTGEKLEGGRTTNVKVSLGTIPLFVRSGAVLPLLGKDVSNAMEDWDVLHLRIYPGKDGYFEIYDDDGVTYDYERGKYFIIPIRWDDNKQELTIGKKRGDLEMRKRIMITWVEKGKGIGYSKPDVEVEYDGKESTTVKRH